MMATCLSSKYCDILDCRCHLSRLAVWNSESTFYFFCRKWCPINIHMASCCHTTCSFFLGQKCSWKGDSTWEKSARIYCELHPDLFLKTTVYIYTIVPMKSHNTILRNWKQYCLYIVHFGACRFLNVCKVNNAPRTQAGWSLMLNNEF